jgi:hypothetical protein
LTPSGLETLNGPVPHFEGDDRANESRAPEYIAVARRLRAPLLAIRVAMPVLTLVPSAQESDDDRSPSEALLSHPSFATARAGVTSSGTTTDPAPGQQVIR